MNGYEVGVSYSNSLTGGQTHDNKTLTFHEDGTLTVKLYAGESVTINDLPAINWSVVETTPSDTTDYYWTGVTYAEAYNDAKVDNGPRDDQYDVDSGNSWANNEKAAEKDNEGADHWNRYESDDTYGMTDSTDGTVVLDVNIRPLTEPDSGPSVAVTLTNNYTRFENTLTITKYVSGPMGDTTADFTFTVVLTDTLNGDAPYELSNDVMTAQGLTRTDEGTYTLTLSDGESITLTLPYGVKATVEETNAQGHTVYSRTDGTATGDFNPNDDNGDGRADALLDYTEISKQTVEIDASVHTIDFMNYRAAAVPTGIDTDSAAPYLVLTACAAFAGLALAGSIVAVRLRRRRQE